MVGPYMTKYAIIYGAVLIVLGVAAYFYTGMASWTALIPAIFGTPILLLGVWGEKKEEVAFFAMVGALVFAFIGFLGTAGAILDFIEILRERGEAFPEDEVAAEELRRAAVVVRSAMAVVTLGFMIQTIRQLIADRNK